MVLTGTDQECSCRPHQSQDGFAQIKTVKPGSAMSISRQGNIWDKSLSAASCCYIKADQKLEQETKGGWDAGAAQGLSQGQYAKLLLGLAKGGLRLRQARIHQTSRAKHGIIDEKFITKMGDQSFYSTSFRPLLINRQKYTKEPLNQNNMNKQNTL